MRNRRLFKSEGKFFCFHLWEVAEWVGQDWDLIVGLKIRCKCFKCGKVKNRSNYLIDEVPDKFIKNSITYV